MGEVETRALVVHIRARLRDVISENIAKRRLKQMHRRVISHRCKSFAPVHARLDLVADGQRAERHGTFVQINAVRFFRVANEKRGFARVQNAFIADLSAAFRVERGSVKHNGHVVALFRNAHRLFVLENGKNLCGIDKLCISAEFGFFDCGKRLVVLPRGSRKALRRASCGLFLRRHKFKEAFFVCFQPVFGGNFFGKIYREAESIVKSERLFAVQYLAGNIFNSFDYISQNGKPLVYRFFEAILFLFDDFLYIRRFFTQFGISGFAFADNDLGKLRKEMRLLYAEQSAVTRRSSQKTAKNVASALV